MGQVEQFHGHGAFGFSAILLLGVHGHAQFPFARAHGLQLIHLQLVERVVRRLGVGGAGQQPPDIFAIER